MRKAAWRLLCSCMGVTMIPVVAHAQAGPVNTSQQPGQPPKAGTENPPVGTLPAEQDGDTQPATPQEGEIIVTGIRRSLEEALDIKRDAVGIVDSIVAEDIGKFPEANIADALVRIPGVELIRDDASGEGREIRLRGLPAEFNLTTINGAAINLGASRAFRYDIFPSELYGRVDVYKTPQAQLVEGGVAGVTDLRTPKPFDFKGQVIRYTVAANYNDFSGKANPRGHVLFSDRFFDDKFGFVISVAGARTDNARTGFDATGNYSGADLGTQTGVFTPAFEGRPEQRGVRYNWNFAAPGTNLNGFSQADINNGLLPRFFSLQGQTNDRERLGVTSTLQFRSGGLDIALSGLYSKLRDRAELQFQGWAVRDALSIARNGVPLDLRLIPVDIRIDENQNIQGTVGNLQYQHVSRFSDTTTEFRYIALDTSYEFNDWLRVSLLASTSKGENEFSQAQLNGLGGVLNRDTITFDTTDPIFPTISVVNRDLLDPNTYQWITNPFLTTQTPANASNFNAFGLSYSGTYRTDEDEQEQFRLAFDADWDLGGLSGVLTVGAQYFDNRKTVRPTVAPNLLNTVDVNGRAFSTLSRDEKQAYVRTTLAQINLDDIAPGGADTWPESWLAWDRAYFTDTLNAFEANRAAPLLFSATYTAQEKILALFAQTDWRTELFGNALRGNIGLRYVDTRTDIDNFFLSGGEFVERNTKGGYDNFLPSASLVYNLTDNLLIRGAWGKTLTRADVGAIAAPLNIPNNGQLFIRVGNPDLRPQQSTSLDAAIEWYFEKGAILSATFFNKDIKDRPAEVLNEVPFNQLGLPASLFTANLQQQLEANPESPITTATQQNAQDYTIKGWEFFYQQNFRFLPAPFDGLGFIGSLTLVDTENLTKRVPNLPTSDPRSFNIVPKTTYAVTAFWEKGPFAIRSSYNWKDEVANFFNNDSNQIGFQRTLNSRGYLDASIAYKVLDNLELRLDGQNLTNTKVFEFMNQVDGLYGDPNSRVAGSFIAGRVFTLSVRGSF